MDNPLAFMLVVVVSSIAGLFAGIAVSNEGIQKDCTALQQFRIGSAVYDCKQKESAK